MSNGSNLAIGATVGAAGGAGIGLAVGVKKAAEIMKPFIDKDGKVNSDTFIANSVKKAEAAYCGKQPQAGNGKKKATDG